MRAAAVSGVLALVLAAFIALPGLIGAPAGPDTGARILLMIGAVLFARDTLEAGVILPGARRAANPHLALHALHMALFGACITQIILWTGPAGFSDSFPLAARIGAALGLLGALTGLLGTRPNPWAPEFDTARPASASLLGRIVYFGWPLAATLIITLNALNPPQGGWTGVFPLFQMAFLPMLVALYPLRGGLASDPAAYAPRLIGLVLLLAGLVAGSA